MQAILSSARMSVLVNGSPTNEFSPSRGLRQGDPIAPYFFLLIGEVLSKFIKVAVRKNLFTGIQLPFSELTIMHYQYADDTILFVKNEFYQIHNHKIILSLFQTITGMSINYSKIHVYHPKNDSSKLDLARDILECQQGSTPFKYLGDWI